MKYKTQNNLQSAWQKIDDACGNIDNALCDISRMNNLPESIIKAIEYFDFSSLVAIKNEIEVLITTGERK